MKKYVISAVVVISLTSTSKAMQVALTTPGLTNFQIPANLSSKPADLTTPISLSNFSLLYAVKKGDIVTINTLLEQGVDSKTQDKHGRFILHLLARYGHEEAARNLIAQGASVNAKYHFNWWKTTGVTPLHEAISAGHKNIVSLLIENGSDINAQDHKGRTPLHRAVIAGEFECAEILLLEGASLDIVDNRGRKAAFYAIKQGNAELTSLLNRYEIKHDENKVEQSLLSRFFSFLPMVDARQLPTQELNKVFLSPTQKATIPGGPPHGISFSKNGLCCIVTGGAVDTYTVSQTDGSLQFKNSQSAQMDNDNPIVSLASTGKMVAIITNEGFGTARVYGIQSDFSWTPVMSFNKEAISTIAFSANGDSVAFGAYKNGTIYQFSSDFTRSSTVNCDLPWILKIVFSPSGNLAVALASDDNMQVFVLNVFSVDPTTGFLTKKIQKIDYVDGAAAVDFREMVGPTFSPDGKFFVCRIRTAADVFIGVFKVDSTQGLSLIQSCPFGWGASYYFSYSFDGSLLVGPGTGGDSYLYIYTVDTISGNLTYSNSVARDATVQGGFFNFYPGIPFGISASSHQFDPNVAQIYMYNNGKK